MIAVFQISERKFRSIGQGGIVTLVKKTNIGFLEGDVVLLASDGATRGAVHEAAVVGVLRGGAGVVEGFAVIVLRVL